MTDLNSLEKLSRSDFSYDLDQERIATHPATPRDSSKLLVYKQENITHKNFTDLPTQLPDNALLVFNDTKVIPARLYAKSETGASFEIFLLEPFNPATREEALQTTQIVTWHCMVRNKRRWSQDQEIRSIHDGEKQLTFSWDNRDQNRVTISWQSGQCFADLLDAIGHIPLPPYIKREDNEQDKADYQTIFATYRGAVAAPTASLHFTDRVLKDLENRGIESTRVTLHVGAGTFLPVTEESVTEHHMHSEPFAVTPETVQTLIDHDGPIIPVGTTAMRVIESLYWIGVRLLSGQHDDLFIRKLEPYQSDQSPSRNEALEAVVEYLEQERKPFRTEIFILPGYQFKVSDGLITNFHQPESTLIMLVAALIGENWRTVYDQAITNNYRFFSYGDSSILLP